ncbi:MAG: hypothetical protein AB9M60_05085 [Leptothrix sp. (in: b-proteobacteria)]
MIHQKSSLTVAACLALASSSLFAAVCATDPATPFTAGPLDPLSKFSTWVVDSNGVGLQTCLDAVDSQGNPPPCIFTPVVPGNAYSAAIGRGVEAFYYLANSKFTTPGANAMSVVMVMGMESAFLSPTPVDGAQTQFSRLRIRINVSTKGTYTIEHPWGTKTFTVTQLLKAGNGQNRDEISDVTDVVFAPDAPSPGLVTPFLKWDPASLPLAPAGYLGDGLTLHSVTGSPCGTNFVRITAVDDKGAPMNIDPTNDDGDNDSHTYTYKLFTIQGKLAPQTITPLAVGSAYYSRAAGVQTSVFADASPSAAVSADGLPMATDGKGRFYLTTPVASGVPPTTVVVAAQDRTKPSVINSQTIPVTDLVTVTRADAVCSKTAPRACTLTVEASSSDVTGAPVLTLGHYNVPLTGGTVTLSNLPSVPGDVSVGSSFNGVGSKPVTVTNQ